ncbi:hypothetical protein NQZ68_011293 [Dissostichus eleginoides]|nr:hypothetical protein NQZ68_011293 [Dissostichus eleginoides]
MALYPVISSSLPRSRVAAIYRGKHPSGGLESLTVPLNESTIQPQYGVTGSSLYSLYETNLTQFRNRTSPSVAGVSVTPVRPPLPPPDSLSSSFPWSFPPKLSYTTGAGESPNHSTEPTDS